MSWEETGKRQRRGMMLPGSRAHINIDVQACPTSTSSLLDGPQPNADVLIWPTCFLADQSETRVDAEPALLLRALIAAGWRESRAMHAPKAGSECEKASPLLFIPQRPYPPFLPTPGTKR